MSGGGGIVEQDSDEARYQVTVSPTLVGAPPPVAGDPDFAGQFERLLYGGWPMILSGLKTWLETGQVLTTPGSLLYG